MSYILDALKKSDQERKRGDVPGLQTVHIPMATVQSTPWVLYAIVCFLLLALAFVIGMVVVGKNTDGLSSEQLISQQQGEVSALLAETVKTKPSVQNMPPQAKHREIQPAIRVERKAVESRVQQKPEKSVIDKQTREKATVSVQELSEVLYLHELPDYQQQSIPEMKFAGHVYSSTPTSRSIIINNSAMSEGDNIMQGLKVELITSNGVVFKFQDTLFKMDILQDWSFE